jgi:prepilin-type N-terminal cleavage/methylation domain-containing protein
MKKSRPGFTIVELLVVIVVIAILAAITIVAYNGFQVRARNTQQITAARSLVTAFAAYVATNGSYPGTSGQNRYCVGVDASSCSTAPANTWYRDTTYLEANLKTIVSTIPTPSAATPLSSSPKLGYIPTSDVTLDGVANPFVVFTVESPGTCSLSGLASGSWPTFGSTAPSQGYTFTDGALRVCMIAMPRTT